MFTRFRKPKIIFVGGVWRDTKVGEELRRDLFDLGMLIARGHFDLSCGPGTGAARPLIQGYRSVLEHGRVHCFLPRAAELLRTGETVPVELKDQHDVDLTPTTLDFPARNLRQVRRADALIIAGGGDGTLTEAIPALADYDKRVAVVDVPGESPACETLRLLSRHYEGFDSRLTFHSTVQDAFEAVGIYLSQSQ